MQHAVACTYTLCSSWGVYVYAGAAASFSTDFWDLGPGHKPDISLEKYKTVIKLLVAATAGCQGAKN
jgi:hypothetical protein